MKSEPRTPIHGIGVRMQQKCKGIDTRVRS
eukprot:COSAG01_NODE_64374_length_276_cov_3.146893_1_plen_29_part_10